MEFCERRAALHLIESVWEDNRFTVEGSILHERVHESNTPEKRGDLIIARGLWIRSFHLGIVGKADVVEFHRTTEDDNGGTHLPGHRGYWRVYPVEYKPGRVKEQRSFQIQLCAQALCLEEMLEVVIPAGSLYYGQTRRRLPVAFDEPLRAETANLAARAHELLSQGRTPPAVYEKKCDRCSLLQFCIPKSTASGRSASRYLAQIIAEAAGPEKT